MNAEGSSGIKGQVLIPETVVIHLWNLPKRPSCPSGLIQRQCYFVQDAMFKDDVMLDALLVRFTPMSHAPNRRTAPPELSSS